MKRYEIQPIKNLDSLNERWWLIKWNKTWEINESDENWNEKSIQVKLHTLKHTYLA